MDSGAVVGLLDTLTFPELITILIIGLVVLGPEKLPGIARQAGQWMAKLRTMSQRLQSEVREVLDDPEMQSLRELGEFAANPRSKIAEYARTAGLDTDDDADTAEETEPAGATAEDDAPPEKLVAVGTDHPMGAVTAVDADEVPVLDARTDAPPAESGTVDAG